MANIFVISPKDANFNFRKELIVKLVLHGNQVTLVSPYGKIIDYYTNVGCKHIHINIDRRGESVLSDLKLFYSYYKLLKKSKPDLVLTYTTKCSVYAGIACRLLNIPYIVNNSGLLDSTQYSKKVQIALSFLYRIGFSKAKCLMYQNTYERDYINTILCNSVHYRDIPGSGVNIDDFPYSTYPVDDNEVIFNFVGRIVKIKGIDEYIECARIIKGEYPHTRFIIYGDYDDDSYKVKIQKAISDGIVEYGGRKKDMRPFIKGCHAVIHPSYYEGMTNVILEHSTMGRIAIASDIPGCREGIDNEITGYLFEVRNVESLISQVRKFLQLSYVEKSNMARLAHEKMVKEFNREIVTNCYLEEINHILNN